MPGGDRKGRRRRKKGAELDDSAAAARIQGLYRIRRARKKVRRIIRSVFTKQWEEALQAAYYFNSKTGESQWTKPVGLGPTDIPYEGYEEEFEADQAAAASGAGAGGDKAAGAGGSGDAAGGGADGGAAAGGGELVVSAEMVPGMTIEQHRLAERKAVNPKAGEILCFPASREEQRVAALALFGMEARLVPVCVRQEDGPYRSVVLLDHAAPEDQDERYFTFDRDVGSMTEYTIFAADDPERFGMLTEYARVEPVIEYLDWDVLGSVFGSYAPRAGMSRYNVFYTHSPYRSLITKAMTVGAIWKEHFSFYAYEGVRLSVRVSEDGTRHAVCLRGILEEWPLRFNFVAFVEPVPGCSRINVLERHDPSHRFKISMGNISTRTGWTLVFSFYALDVPVPGTTKFSVQQNREPEGEDQCRISEHMPVKPWTHMTYFYAYKP